MKIIPNIMATSPIMMFAAEKLISIDVIPRNSKLNPIIMDTTAELKTGQIIKINPKIIDNIPDTLFNSIFFPPNFVIFTFQVKNIKIQKALCFYIINYLLILFIYCYCDGMLFYCNIIFL